MRPILPLAFLLIASPALADSPAVEAVTASKSGDTWTFNVTISHADEGWDHYADGWEVVGPDGTQLGYRKLLHPHVNRAHDSVHEWGEPFSFELN